MSDTAEVERLALAWLEAFNAHDVAAMVSLYGDGATHTSPKIRGAGLGEGGRIVGRAALESWWRGAIARTPSLRYELVAITASSDRVCLEYLRHEGGEPPLPVCNAFDVRDGRFVASRVYHG